MSTPSWVTKFVRENADALKAKADMQVKAPALGCGHFGCVFPTNDPAWVVKITRDPTEGPMVQRIMALKKEGAYGMDGIVNFKTIFRGKDVLWRGKMQPVFVIVREAITPVKNWFIKNSRGPSIPREGGFIPATYESALKNIPDYVLQRSLDALAKAKDAAGEFHDLKTQHRKDTAKQKFIDAVSDVGDAFPYVGEAMISLLDQDILLRDVHANNIAMLAHDRDGGDGAPAGTIVVFDLGHTPTDPVESEMQLLGVNGFSEDHEWRTKTDDPLERGESPDWDPAPYTCTRWDEGFVDPRLLVDLPGKKDEHVKLTFPPGRYSANKWAELVSSLRAGYDEDNPVFIVKEKDGSVFIYEGNHRVRASIEAGLAKIPVEIRYMAGSQRNGQLVIDPATGMKGRGWVGAFDRGYHSR